MFRRVKNDAIIIRSIQRQAHVFLDMWAVVVEMIPYNDIRVCDHLVDDRITCVDPHIFATAQHCRLSWRLVLGGRLPSIMSKYANDFACQQVAV